MAEQTQPVRRKVALKVIKPGMDTRQVIARFEAERQALALMDHPNIAKVLDAGATDTGRPYFVMELVQGDPDHRVLRRAPARRRASGWSCSSRSARPCSTPTRRGSSTATSSRRTSWSTLHDGEPVPKVIDFGVAKATGQQLTDKTLFTGFAQMVGTPLYMSPEQAELERPGRRHPQRHLLAGRAALRAADRHARRSTRERLEQAAFDEMRRIIREEEPPRPSTRLSTTRATRCRSIAANRGTEPAQAEPSWCAASWTGS